MNMENKTFTAALKRDGQDTRLIPGCVTRDGYLCRANGKTLQPFWDSEALKSAGISNEQVSGIRTLDTAIQAGHSERLIRFGKQQGYWVWNHEAAERKKLVDGKTVYLYENKTAEWDDDEPEIRMSDKPYPKEVWDVILPHIRKDRRGYEIINHTSMKAALSAIGWKTNR